MIVSLSNPESWTLAESTTTFGKVLRPFDFSISIASLNLLTVAEIPQTTGIAGTEPEPFISLFTNVQKKEASYL